MRLYKVAKSVLSPLLGARLLFPMRFNSAVEALRKQPGGAQIAPEQAFWYYGSKLKFSMDPANLTWRLSDYVKSGSITRWIGSSFLDSADWRQALSLIGRSPIHREMVRLVQADFEFRRTPAYQVMCHRAATGRPLKRNGIILSNTDLIDAYFRYCVELGQSVKTYGVVSRQDLPHLVGGVPRHGARSWVVDSAERDVGVAIAQNGRIVRHLGGKHRTALAQALGLQLMPVEVRLVHVGWIGRQMRRTGLPAHLAVQAGIQELRLQEPQVLGPR